MAQERLQKVLAAAGIASRRKAEQLITDGQVKVDGQVVTELGTRVDPRRAKIEVGHRRVVPELLSYWVLHKPRGYVSTLDDPEGRPALGEFTGRIPGRIFPVGRLDYHTSGVLLLSNDGDFADALAHPRGGVPRKYVVKVKGVVADTDLERWHESIEIDGRRTKPAKVTRLRIDGDKTWLEVVLKEGRNRHVRRLAEHAGANVMRLARTEFGGITIEGLRPGHLRPLKTEELVALQRAYGVPKRVRSPVDNHPGAAGRGQARKPAKSGGAAGRGQARKPAKQPRQAAASRGRARNNQAGS